MHGFVPLSRFASGIVQPSTSRIPHLTLHIRRQTRSRTPCRSTLASREFQHQRRFQHSSTPIGDLSALTLVRYVVPHEREDRRSYSPAIDSEDALAAEDRSLSGKALVPTIVTMEELLKENHPERILQGLVTPSIGDIFIANADDDTFTKAICALDPEYFILPFRSLYRFVKPTLETEPRFRLLKSLEERMDTFASILDRLVTLRQERGHLIPLEIYRHLLRCAAAGGHGNMARNIFRILMPENNITPDVECYNYFMEALNWNQAYGRLERYKLRVVPKHMELRSAGRRRPGFRGHGVASPKNPDNDQSLRLEVLRIFNELVRQGLKGDEATFCNLMIAMAREGDVASVRSVLKSVWNIDVDALERYDEEELESPTFYEDGSPLRPTQALLFTVVHAFGTNNQVNVASMLLDYISRNYNMTIPEDVWTHLLEWTFVLAARGEDSKVSRGYGVGRLSLEGVESLYALFHGEPYNVPPNIVNLIFRVKNRSQRKLLDKAVDDIRECMRMLDDDRTLVSALYDRMVKYVGFRYNRIFDDGVASADFLALRRAYVYASLRLDCHLQLILIAVRNALKEHYWPTAKGEVGWAYRRLPQLVAEWQGYLPNVIPYYTPTGHVTLLGDEHRIEAIYSANSSQMTKVGSMRAMFDTFSPARLRHAADYVRRVPKGLAAFEEEAASEDGENLSDWVLRTEERQRAERLKARDYGHLRQPSADWREDEWRPWSQRTKK